MERWNSVFSGLEGWELLQDQYRCQPKSNLYSAGDILTCMDLRRNRPHAKYDVDRMDALLVVVHDVVLVYHRGIPVEHNDCTFQVPDPRDDPSRRFKLPLLAVEVLYILLRAFHCKLTDSDDYVVGCSISKCREHDSNLEYKAHVPYHNMSLRLFDQFDWVRSSVLGHECPIRPDQHCQRDLVRTRWW